MRLSVAVVWLLRDPRGARYAGKLTVTSAGDMLLLKSFSSLWQVAGPSLLLDTTGIQSPPPHLTPSLGSFSIAWNSICSKGPSGWAPSLLLGTAGAHWVTPGWGPSLLLSAADAQMIPLAGVLLCCSSDHQALKDPSL